MSPIQATKSVQLAVLNATIATNAVISAKFARKKKKKENKKVHEVQNHTASEQENNSALDYDDVFLGSLEVDSINNIDRNKVFTAVEITAKPYHKKTTSIVCKIGTGAETNVISKTEFDKIIASPSDKTLGPSQILTAYGGQKIECMGTCQQKGLVFNKDKVQFKCKEVSFFGHTWTSQGIKPDNKKVSAILDIKPSEDVKSLQSFLGLVNYLTRYSGRLATLSAPLRDLTKKDTAYSWGPEHGRAFTEVKKAVSSLDVLRYFDPHAETVIEKDLDALQNLQTD